MHTPQTLSNQQYTPISAKRQKAGHLNSDPYGFLALKQLMYQVIWKPAIYECQKKLPSCLLRI